MIKVQFSLAANRSALWTQKEAHVKEIFIPSANGLSTALQDLQDLRQQPTYL